MSPHFCLCIFTGVNSSSIAIEDKSLNTVQNAHNCVGILQGLLPPNRQGTSNHNFVILESSSDTSVQCIVSDVEVHLVTSSFHMPRSLYIFEAVFTQCAPWLVPLLHPAPAPYGQDGAQEPAGAGYQGGTNKRRQRRQTSFINRQTEAQRLDGEAYFIRHKLVQQFLPEHIPGLAIAPLPCDRLNQALDDITRMQAMQQIKSEAKQRRIHSEGAQLAASPPEDENESAGTAPQQQQLTAPERRPSLPEDWLHATLSAQSGKTRGRAVVPHSQALAELQAGRKRTHWIWYMVMILL